MMSLPDFEQKKIVCINSGEELNSLKFVNSNITLFKDGKKVNQISCHLVLALFIIGEATLTTALIREAKEHGISIFLLNYSLKPYAEIIATAEGNYLLRERQYEMEEENKLHLAKELIKNKILNQAAYLKSAKDIINKEKIEKTLIDLENATHWQSVLGIEGAYSSFYFKNVFDDLDWMRRAPTTKEDVPNLLLDIGYTFLFNFTDAVLRLFGFDTYRGFYHQLFFQRKSLTCDVVEPLRILVDKTLVKMHNLGQINEKDFEFSKGSYRFKDFSISKKYTKIWFDLLMDNKEEIYTYVLGFYRHIMNPEKYTFPNFIVK